MSRAHRRTVLAAWLAAALAVPAAPVAAQAMDCERLREQIAEKFRAGGIAQPRLLVLDKDAAAAGQVMGRCELGSRKIVRLAAAETAASAPPAVASTARATAPGRRAAADDDILTECLDGRVQRGGDCGRRRASP
jgi:hypothetical protein